MNLRKVSMYLVAIYPMQRKLAQHHHELHERSTHRYKATLFNQKKEGPVCLHIYQRRLSFIAETNATISNLPTRSMRLDDRSLRLPSRLKPPRLVPCPSRRAGESRECPGHARSRGRRARPRRLPAHAHTPGCPAARRCPQKSALARLRSP